MANVYKVVLFLLVSLAAFAQGSRYDNFTWTVAGYAPGSSSPIYSVPNATISVCNYPSNAVPCTNKATTFTDSTLTTSCSSSTQVVLTGTSTCIASSDNYGNFGVWVAPGLYDYTVTYNGVSSGPYSFIAGDSAPSLMAPGGQTSTITVSSSGDYVIPSGAFTSASCPAINVTASNVRIIGAGKGQTVIVSSCASGDIVNVSGSKVQIEGMTLRSSVTKSGGAGLHCSAGCQMYFDHMAIEPSYNGFQADGGTSFDTGDDVLIGASGSTPAGANWNAAIFLAGNPTGSKVITDTRIGHIVVSIDRACSAGGCVILDSGTDSIQLNKLEVIATGSTCRPVAGGSPCGSMVLFRHTLGGGLHAPRTIRLFDCNIEAGINDDAIKVDGAEDVVFFGCTADNGLRELEITGGTGVRYIAGRLKQSQRELVLISGGGYNRIETNILSGASQAGNGSYDAVSITGGTPNYVKNNWFYDIGAVYTNHANYQIQVAGGVPSGGSYFIYPNYFDPAAYVTAPINDLAGNNISEPLGKLEAVSVANDELKLGTSLLATQGSTITSTGGVSSSYNGLFLNSNGSGQEDAGVQYNTSLPSWRFALGGGSTSWVGAADTFGIGRVAAGGTMTTPAVLFKISSAGQVSIPIATGTSPLLVNSTTVNTNFNADTVDGKHAADLVQPSGTPTVNHAACVKAVGPPVQIGYCSTVVAADGSCTCN